MTTTTTEAFETGLRAEFEAWKRTKNDGYDAWSAALWATERAAKQAPMQPVVIAEDGKIRFKENRIVSAFYEKSRASGFGLNEAALGDFTPEEHMQLAQLIGYSVDGYGTLSYVSDESYEEADKRAAAIRASSGKGDCDV